MKRILIFLSLLFSLLGHASNDQTALSVGAGVAAPSQTTALFENPAGLIYHDFFSFYVNGGSPNSSLNPVGYGGGFFWGNGSSVGMGSLFQTTDSASLIRLGGAAYFSPIKTAIGISGGVPLDSTNKTIIGASKSINLGALYNPGGMYQFGFTVVDLESGPDFGFGGAIEPVSHATLALDASVNDQLKGLRIKPGLGIHVSSFQISLGYGLEIDKNASSFIPDKLSAALGIRVTDNAHLQFYYNQISKYYAAVLIRL